MSLPPIVLVLLIAAAVLFVLSHGRALHGATHRAQRTVWCPLHDRQMTAVLEERIWDGQRVDVRACSAFAPPDAVACSKACLRLTRRPPSAPLLRAWWHVV